MLEFIFILILVVITVYLYRYSKKRGGTICKRTLPEGYREPECIVKDKNVVEVDDETLLGLGLHADLFRAEGIYYNLLKLLRLKLNGEELKRSEVFIEKALSDTLDYNMVFDELADSQIIIIFVTIMKYQKERDSDGAMGQNARAYGIIIACENMNNIIESIKTEGNPQQSIAYMRKTLKEFYIRVQDDCKKRDNMLNYDYNDLKALIGDVQFKYKVPIINL